MLGTEVGAAGAHLADCRARLAFDLLANTWNSVVLWALRHGPARPVDHREAPPRVEYALTDLGRSLLGPIGTFGEWAAEHGDEVVAAQDRV